MTRSTRPTTTVSSSAIERRRRLPSARCEPIDASSPAGAHAARVLEVRQGVKVPPGGLAEQADQGVGAQVRHLGDGADAAPVELGGGLRADAPQALDR